MLKIRQSKGRTPGGSFRYEIIKGDRVVYFTYTKAPTPPKALKAWVERLNAMRERAA